MANCGKCGAELTMVSPNRKDDSKTKGICPEHGRVYTDPAMYMGEDEDDEE